MRVFVRGNIKSLCKSRRNSLKGKIKSIEDGAVNWQFVAGASDVMIAID